MSTITNEQIMDLKDSLYYEKEKIITKTIIKNKLTGYAFDRGQSILPYKNQYNEMFKIIEGRAEVMLNGENYDLEEGEEILMPKDSIHALFAKTKLKLAMVKI